MRINSADLNVVEENRRRYLARKALFLQYGYDIDAERADVIDKAGKLAGNILEAGTGKGHFSLALALRGYRFTTFDISPTEQQFARLNLRYHGLEEQVCFDIADGEALPYQDKHFDCIFSVNLVHHLDDVGKVFAELIRVLTPTGKLVVSDMNATGLALLDKIHALEGDKHPVGPENLSDVADFLHSQDFEVAFYAGNNQDVLVAQRKNA